MDGLKKGERKLDQTVKVQIISYLKAADGRSVHVISKCHPTLGSRSLVHGCHDLRHIPTRLWVGRLDVDVVPVSGAGSVISARSGSVAGCLTSLSGEVEVIVHTLDQPADTVLEVARAWG